MKQRRIEHVEILPVQVPITRTFNFASGSAGAAGAMAKLVFVKVTDSEGCYGWGEARAHPQWSYESPESLVSTLRNYLAPAVIGMPIWDRCLLHARMHGSVGRGPSTGMPLAKAALDIAVHDLCARASGLPLRAFLGGSTEQREVELSWTIAVNDVSEASDQVRAGIDLGFKHYNFKVGSNYQKDLALTKIIKAALPEGAFFWADANQGVPYPEAVRIAKMLEDYQVDILEQPLHADQMLQMRRLREQVSIPMAIDESSVSPADFFNYAAFGLVDYYVLKLTRSGGIWPSLQQLGVATSAGYGLLVSGLSDSMITKLAACQVASAFGFTAPAALNGSQFMDDSMLFPTKDKVEKNGSVIMHDKPGVGIEPDEASLRENLWS